MGPLTPHDPNSYSGLKIGAFGGQKQIWAPTLQELTSDFEFYRLSDQNPGSAPAFLNVQKRLGICCVFAIICFIDRLRQKTLARILWCIKRVCAQICFLSAWAAWKFSPGWNASVPDFRSRKNLSTVFSYLQRREKLTHIDINSSFWIAVCSQKFGIRVLVQSKGRLHPKTLLDHFRTKIECHQKCLKIGRLVSFWASFEHAGRMFSWSRIQEFGQDS